MHSFISLRAKSVKIEEVEAQNFDKSSDILDVVKQELEINEFIPPITETCRHH